MVATHRFTPFPRSRNRASARSHGCRSASGSSSNRSSEIATAKRFGRKDVEKLANWNAKSPANAEIPFVVARIVLQDFTGVPLLVDLAAMRCAVQRLGGDPKIIEPLVPVDLVVDHSVQVDFAGSAAALRLNMDMEFKRNRERYRVSEMGAAGVQDLRPRAAGHRHRAPGESRISRQGRARDTDDRLLSRIRWSAPTPTRR